jgi:hypothetical protein
MSHGGQTWSNITGNSSAYTTSLAFTATVSDNGYEYRAVLTNSAGTTATSSALSTVLDLSPRLQAA